MPFHRFFVSVPDDEQANRVIKARFQELVETGTLSYACSVDINGDTSKYQYIGYTAQMFQDLPDAINILASPGWNVAVRTVRELKLQNQTFYFLPSKFETGHWSNELRAKSLGEEVNFSEEEDSSLLSDDEEEEERLNTTEAKPEESYDTSSSEQRKRKFSDMEDQNSTSPLDGTDCDNDDGEEDNDAEGTNALAFESSRNSITGFDETRDAGLRAFTRLLDITYSLVGYLSSGRFGAENRYRWWWFGTNSTSQAEDANFTRLVEITHRLVESSTEFRSRK